jgi:CheY-like chemotaxis protein
VRAEGFSGIKVMMVTTEAENDFILRALDAGADEYLMKPFDDEALTKNWPCSAWWRPERWRSPPNPHSHRGRLGRDAQPAALGGQRRRRPGSGRNRGRRRLGPERLETFAPT